MSCQNWSCQCETPWNQHFETLKQVIMSLFRLVCFEWWICFVPKTQYAGRLETLTGRCWHIHVVKSQNGCLFLFPQGSGWKTTNTQVSMMTPILHRFFRFHPDTLCSFNENTQVLIARDPWWPPSSKKTNYQLVFLTKPSTSNTHKSWMWITPPNIQNWVFNFLCSAQHFPVSVESHEVGNVKK